jgi:maltose-binding protein MalE
MVLILVSCGAGDDGTSDSVSATDTGPSSAVTPTFPLPTLLTPVATQDQSRDLRLWLSWDGHDLEAFERVVELFVADYPNIPLRITYVPPDQVISALRNAPPGEGPTVIFAPSRSGPVMWEAGLIQDLTDRVPSDLHEHIQSVAWSQAVYEGRVIGLPLSLQGVLLYRNRELAAERAATVDDMVLAATELLDQGGIGAALDFGFIYSASHLEACGGSIIAADGSMGFDGSVGRCWLELETQLSETGRPVFNSDEDLELFSNRESAWMIGMAVDAPEIARSVGGDNLAIDMWPDYEATGRALSGFVWTENAYFPTNISQSELDSAWAFVSFILTPQAQISLADPQGAWHIPVLTSLDLEQGLQIQVLGALLNGLPLPLDPLVWRSVGSLENAVRLVAQQGADPLLALSVLVTEMSTVFPTPDPTPEN